MEIKVGHYYKLILKGGLTFDEINPDFSLFKNGKSLKCIFTSYDVRLPEFVRVLFEGMKGPLVDSRSNGWLQRIVGNNLIDFIEINNYIQEEFDI